MPTRISKRKSPSDSQIAYRAEELDRLGGLHLEDVASDATPSFETGNGKIGFSGRFYKSIKVWNLPPMATCPGRSTWCSENCYNADPRADVFPIKRWQTNWGLLEKFPEELAAQIATAISAMTRPAAIRIHSSGDFYSQLYVSWWRRIIENAPDVSFWCYTRSWTNSDLIADLEMLRQMPNVQLFASWDHTMPDPPKAWRLSIMASRMNPPHLSGLDCPEQYYKGPNCANCGYCIRAGEGNVVFDAH